MSSLRAIVSDVDGTLAEHATGLIPTANIDAVAAAHARGLKVALATIRKRDTAEQIVAQLGIPCALVCEGGATVYDEDRALIRRIVLPLDVALAIATMADERRVPMASTVDEINYFGPGYEPNALLGASSVAVPSNADALTSAPTRLVIRDAEAVKLVVETFPDAPLHVVRHYRPSGLFIDGVITHADANKAQAVDAVLDYWGLAWSQVIAFGDAESDIDMIRRAGVGVAMANGTQPLREIADFVTTEMSEAGVADALHRFVLSP
jgi:Cof subfamily protein (haloacid dehalogenase superfamily)